MNNYADTPGEKDIFLSYASKDVEKARVIIAALKASGRTVWWDNDLLGYEDFSIKIETALKTSRCVVVLWSKYSVESEWVRIECYDAIERQKLIQVFIEPVIAPLRFRLRNGIKLYKWNGDRKVPEYKRLLSSIEAKLGLVPIPPDQRPKPKPTIGDKFKLGGVFLPDRGDKSRLPASWVISTFGVPFTLLTLSHMFIAFFR